MDFEYQLSNDYDKFNKKMDGGFTFYSMISRQMLFIAGKIPQIDDDLKHPYETRDVNTPFYEFDYSEKDTVPIQVSCSKHSIAVLLKNINENKTVNHDDMKDYKETLTEILESIKSKGKTFQSYFLKELTSEKLFAGNNDPESKYMMIDADFKEKITELLQGNEKLLTNVTRLTEKLKAKSGVNNQNKVDLLMFYNLLNGTNYTSSKISLFGEIVRVLEAEMTDEIKKFCRENYNSAPSKTNFIYEIPLLLLPVTQVELGEEHILLLISDGELYAWGDNKYGACGTGDLEFVSKPKKVKFSHSVQVKKIACGGKHSLCIDSFDNIYSWGLGKSGRLGHGNEHNYNTPKAIDTLSNTKIFYISAGDNYSACLSSGNALYTWGCGEFGRLGHAENTDELLPKKVENIKDGIVIIRCGYYCLLAFSVNKEVYVLGAKSLFIKKDTGYPKSNLPSLKNSRDIRKIEFPASPGKEVDIIDCVVGYQFLMMIVEERGIKNEKNRIFEDKNSKKLNKNENLNKTSTAEVGDKIESIERKEYFWGNLNLSSTKFNANFNVITNFEQKHEALGWFKSQYLMYLNAATGKVSYEENKIKRVLCSDNNTAVLTLQGEVYVFGSYIYGVASKKIEQMYYPIPFKGKKITKISMGANHILVMTNNFEVYGWGKNDSGQLGLGNANKFYDVPILIEKMKNKGVKTVKCSENYSACLTFNYELFLFGDISFIENSQFINHQLIPKQMNWGRIYKISCGPTTILMFIQNKDTGNIEIRSIGNGSYGKLGTNSENDDNMYSPALVDVPINITDKERIRSIKLACSKYMSAILEIINPTPSKFQSSLWVFGMCYKLMFSSKDLENLKNARKKYQNIDSNMCVQPKPIKVSNWENMQKIAMSDSSFYVITNKEELRYIGMFFSLKKDPISEKKTNIRGQYLAISVGIDHAAAITKKNTLVTWGYNFMNKLGFAESSANLDKLNLDDGFSSNISALFHKEPESITEINKIFEKQESKNKALQNQIETPLIKEEEKSEDEEETKSESNDHKKEEEVVDSDNIFNEVQRIIKHKYEDLEYAIIKTENSFKEKIKKLLASYEFLIKNERDTKNLKKILYNQANFRIIEPPLNIKLKENRQRKYPQEFYDYRKNYKALLTTLRIHPCYLMRLIESNLMKDEDLYKIIKYLFSNIYSDNYSKLLLITLAKMVFEKDLKLSQEKIDKEIVKDKQNKRTILDDYKLVKIETNPEKINLFGQIFKIILKSELEDNIYKIDAFAAIIVNHISKTGSKPGNNDIETAMTLFYPENEKPEEEQNYANAQLNGKIDAVFTIINLIFEILELPANDENVIAKEYVFNLSKEIYNDTSKDKSNDETKFITFGKMTRTLIREMYSIFRTFLDPKDYEKIDEWMAKNMGLILFRRLIKILENPIANLTLNGNIAIDKYSFTTFIEKSRFNFYSVAFLFKYILKTIIASEDTNMGNEGEIFKKVDKKLKELTSIYTNKLRVFISKLGQEVKNERTDIMNLKEYFIHSINEKHYPINFPLHYLKSLHQICVNNIDKLRVLNKGFDLLDLIFFNTNKDYYLGKENGLYNIEVDREMMIQQKLKTRALAFENPKTLNRCVHCKSLVLKEFNYSNEDLFFDECQFFMKNSKHGFLIQIFKEMKTITSDNITELFKLELKDPLNKLKDNLIQLFTIFAYEKKNDLMLEEEDMRDEQKLFELIVNDKTVKEKLTTLSREILEKYKQMEDHRIYQNQLDSALDEIGTFITLREEGEEEYYKNISKMFEIRQNSEVKKNKSDSQFNNQLFKRIQRNYERGYGNPDLEKIAETLDNNAMLVSLIKSINDMPRSKNLFEKLSVSKKSKLLPFREYGLKKLMDDRVIINVLVNTGYKNIYLNAHNFRVLIQKTPSSEFNVSLVKETEKKSSLFAVCTSKKKEDTSVLIRNELFSNSLLNRIMNKSYHKNSCLKISDFIEIECKSFIQILKSLTVLGLDQ